MRLDLSNLEPVRKDPASNSGDCCGLYRLPDGGHVAVGRKLEGVDPAHLAYGLKDDEVPVYLPPGVVVE